MHLISFHEVEELGAESVGWKLFEGLGVPLETLNPWGIFSGCNDSQVDLLIVVQVGYSILAWGMVFCPGRRRRYRKNLQMQ